MIDLKEISINSNYKKETGELINIAIMVNRIWLANYMNYPLFKLQ